MLSQILKHTPAWVYFLFFVLLIVGYLQSKTRVVSRSKVALLPAAMILLSAYGVLSAFGASVTGIIAWFIGVGIAVLLTHVRRSKTTVTYSKATYSYSIPGSWRPLALMMAIFFTKYAVGVTLARKPILAGTQSFIVCISSIYGFLSGVFFGGAIILFRIAKQDER